MQHHLVHLVFTYSLHIHVASSKAFDDLARAEFSCSVVNLILPHPPKPSFKRSEQRKVMQLYSVLSWGYVNQCKAQHKQQRHAEDIEKS